MLVENYSNGLELFGPGSEQALAVNPYTAPIAAFRFAEDGPGLGRHCARHGEDNATVLAELGYDSDAIAMLSDKGVI